MEVSSTMPRVSVKFKEKQGKHVLDEVWWSMDVPVDQDHEDVTDSIVKRIETCLNKYKNIEEPMTYNSAGMGVNGSNVPPNCIVCGAQMKLSKNGKFWNCTKAKWQKNGEEWFNSGCKGVVKA